MSKNKVNYDQLSASKEKILQQFDEFKQNMNAVKTRTAEMEDSWSGTAYDAVAKKIDGMTNRIDKAKQQMGTAIDKQLQNWYQSFDDAEKAMIAEANEKIND